MTAKDYLKFRDLWHWSAATFDVSHVKPIMVDSGNPSRVIVVNDDGTWQSVDIHGLETTEADARRIARNHLAETRETYQRSLDALDAAARRLDGEPPDEDDEDDDGEDTVEFGEPVGEVAK